MSYLIINVKNTMIVLCVVVVLTICHCAGIQSTNTEGNVPYINYTDDDSVGYEMVESNYNTTDVPKLTPYISGGSFAKLGQYPYMAVVHRLVGYGIIDKCGGTIVSNRWVLTAGHCVANKPRIFLIVFGIVDKSGIGYNWFVGPGLSMITIEVVLHPQYEKYVNDIALLHMPSDIPFSATIQPIKLADHSYEGEVLVNRNANVIGWGKDNITSRGTTNLKYATLPIMSNEECNQYWKITDKHICMTPGLEQDACHGDSGGPLTITENGQDIQVGIVSFGDAYCPSTFPKVFTRVTAFTEWIRDTINTYFTYHICYFLPPDNF